MNASAVVATGFRTVDAPRDEAVHSFRRAGVLLPYMNEFVPTLWAWMSARIFVS